VSDISEAASEKQRRGTPLVHDPAMLAFYRQSFPEIRTHRGLQDKAYGLTAYTTLADVPGCEWLCSTKEEIDAGSGQMRFTILAELGRIKDEEVRKVIALEICRQRPRSKAAVAMIRRYRTGKAPKATALNLANMVIGCINGYLERTNGADLPMVMRALQFVTQSYADANDER
jgi:hypothetical protein